MKKVIRFGVIGTGGMGRGHCRFLQEVKRAKLVGVCDKVTASAEEAAKEFKVRAYPGYRELIDSGDCDAVIVATPHYQHPTIGTYALKRGVHLLCEKPVAVSVKGADRLNRAAKRAARDGVRFACMFQMRSAPVFRKAKELIDQGTLGTLYRTQLEMAWLRTQTYYDGSSWRGTWQGEGGGLLLNQAPHTLDMFQWLGGMPVQLQAWWRAARHDIEVEDEVYALLEYNDGGRGIVTASVNEVPCGETYTFVGDRGKLVIRGGKIELHTFAPGLTEFINDCEQGFAMPEVKKRRVQLDDTPAGHAVVIRNFVEAILDDAPLWTPGEDGVHSLELANAMTLSGLLKKPVKLPLDRDAYEKRLKGLRGGR